MRIFYLDVTPLEDDALFRQMLKTVSEDRVGKVHSLRLRQDQNLSLGAGILLDQGLREWGLCEKEMRYQRGENGKPFFENDPQLHFSISHSGTMVAVAFADREIGCDIEKIRDVSMDLAKRFFKEQEYQWLLSLNGEEQRVCFFRYWTLKESYLKATGLGLKLPLNSFWMRLDSENITAEQNGTKLPYSFGEIGEIPGYKLSFCIKGEMGKEAIICEKRSVKKNT
ncbi:MAG: 4'-phosphopantetheinyl transferase superfamily protein [Clostridia bacterium]|nr:4'-phosphopantetheinyl transferase superfamily protein [Clostridia bacterium]